MARGKYFRQHVHERSSFDSTSGILGLDLDVVRSLPKYLGFSHQEEVKKVAIHNKRRWITWTVLWHLLPIVAALGVSILNIRGYYIGGELAGQVGMDKAKLDALQFAAKLHELMMHSSLQAIATWSIRYRLEAGWGVPFGAVFGDQHVTHISYLWSKAFLGAIRSGYHHVAKKFVLAILSICTIVAVVVAPSSAIAIQPELDFWPAGGTSLWINATSDELWPSRLNGSTIKPACAEPGGYSDRSCPSAQWPAVQSYLAVLANLPIGGAVPETVEFTGKNTGRQLHHRTRIGVYRFRWTVATISNSVLADAIAYTGSLWAFAAANAPIRYRYRYRRDALYSMDTRQPVTHVYCASVPSTQESPVFPALNAPLGFGGSGGMEYDLKAFPNATLPNGWPKANGSDAQISWFELPNSFGNVSIGALIALPSLPGNASPPGITCSVDARWAGCRLLSRRNLIMVADCQPAGMVDWNIYANTPNNWDSYQSVNLTANWARFLNPHLIDNTNNTVFGALASTASVLNPPISRSNHSARSVEVILAMMITNGLAQTAYDRGLQGNVIGFDKFKSPGGWERTGIENFMHGRDAFAVDAAQTSRWSKFRMGVAVEGYSYNIHTKTRRVAIAILMIYAFIGLLHIACHLAPVRKTSSAWTNVTDVAALAMNSTPTQALDNTCAGIEKVSTYELPVRIVPRGPEGDHLELVFGDPDGTPIARIEPGKPYGKLDQGCGKGGVSELKSQATHAFIPALVIRPGHNLMGGRNLLGGYAIGVLSYRITTLGTSDDLLDRMSKVRGLLYLLWPLTYLPRHDAQKTEKQW
ncbi:MAG: hypothetical protein M1813_007803 [Trichoglossum hirsutum]|nr:MAG: hypothetical protein M1813_007803 [Trichoglossum hirsutum]